MSIELLKATRDADPANDSLTRLLLLARAQLGETDSARSTADQLVEALKTRTPARALQQLFRDVATGLAGLGDQQFCALLKRDTVGRESPD